VYVGVCERQLDERGRVALPSTYRSTIGEQCYLTVGHDNCVQVTDAATFEEMAAEIVANVKAGTETRARQRAFAGSVEVSAIDKQGRITIPAGLLHHAGIDPRSAVTVLGDLDHIEIWETSRWEQQDAPGREQMAESPL
jgi:MraZ protein